MQEEASEDEMDDALSDVTLELPLSIVFRLNNEQTQIFNRIVSAIETNDDSRGDALFCIDGFAGTGKTFLLKALIANCEHKGTECKAMAYTKENASQLSANASTIHSAFIIDLHTSTSSVLKNKRYSKTLSKAKVTIIDLINFCNSTIFTEVEEQSRTLMKNNRLFGGKVVVIAGDSNGLPPIQSRYSTAPSAFHSPLLRTFERCTLAENMRFRGCDQFFNFLKAYAQGSQVSLPEKCFVTSITELVNHTFGYRIDLDELKRLNNRKILIDDSRLNLDAIMKECVGRVRCDQTVFINTVGKVQSRNYDCDGLYAPLGLFDRKMMYAAMSRAKSFDNLKIFVQT